MAGFLYFRAGTVPPTPDDIAELGLAHAFPSKSIDRCQCIANTPTGASGFVFGDTVRMAGRSVTMNMDEQKWEKLPGSELHVGYWKDAKPKPADLARAERIAGHAVKLGDGQEWIVPLVRSFDRATLKTVSTLPCYMTVDDNGDWHRGDVLEQYAHLWAVTQPIDESLMAEYVTGDEPPAGEIDIFKTVVVLLQTNYVVGPGELSLLRAFTNEGRCYAAAMASCDWPAYMANRQTPDAV
jgi:hypothetical protein